MGETADRGISGHSDPRDSVPRENLRVLEGVQPAEGRFRATKLEKALDWAAALAPSPLRVATSCCGMSIVQGGDILEALGTGPLATSSRSADLLIIAGSITHRQVPLILRLYERMLEPRWVMAWGACAISGGAYDNYATVSGLREILPVDVVVPGCPPSPVALREALALLRSGKAREKLPESRDRAEWPILRTRVAVESSESLEVVEGNEYVDRG